MKGQTNKNIRQAKLQRNLRSNMTDAELRLWKHLRGRQMGGFRFRRQHPFANYILDFVCLEAMLIIEVDGGQHSQRTEQDEIRTASLNAAGFRVLRFWNNEVLTEIESVKESIWRALQPLRASSPRQVPHPHPNLPPEGEGI